MNLPNALTVIRIVLVPLLVVVLLTKFEGRAVAGVHVEFVAAAIFGLASLTDWLDGYLARRRQQITWVGQVLDDPGLAGPARPGAGVDGGGDHRP
jgi:CDP-diacylglycerol--glycerol-3-phosphate 3-phosphatidyltransferase